MDCNFPGCYVRAEPTGYCIFHKIYSGVVSVKITKAPNKESAKMKEDKKTLKELAKKIIAKHPKCQIKSEKCTGKSECVHNVRGRLKDNLLNEKTLVAACYACNLWVETDTAAAIKKGFKKSKFKTE